MGQVEEKFVQDIGFRAAVIAEIRTSNDIRKRMQNSQRDIDVYNGKMFDYLVHELNNRYSASTVREMPIISQINLTKKVANAKGSLYANQPDRLFMDMSDDQREKTELVYQDMEQDNRMKKSNRYYELQKQNHVLYSPKNGKITASILAGHRLNVVPSLENAEQGEVYIISTFDESWSDIKQESSNHTNEASGDPDDYKAFLERHIVWTPNYHFSMNGKGVIQVPEGMDIEKAIVNEIAPLIPIVEISDEKDGKYWVDSGSEISRFGVEFCAQLTNWAHIVNLQAFAQAWLKGPEDLQPTEIKIGPNHILRLPTSPDENKEIDFGYSNPNSDLAGVKDLVLTLLSLFLSSEEIDPTTVTGQAQIQSFSSGIERLLSMIENFKPSKEALSLYEKAEQDAFNIVKAWMDALRGSDALDPKYQTTLFGDKGAMAIKFNGPETVLSETEELDIVDRRIENGTMSTLGAIMRLEKVDKDDAKEIALEIDEDENFIEMKKAELKNEPVITEPINNDLPEFEIIPEPMEGEDDNQGE